MNLRQLIDELEQMAKEHGDDTGVLYADNNGEIYFIVQVNYNSVLESVIISEP